MRQPSTAKFDPNEQVQSNVMAEQMRIFVENTPSICLFASLFAVMFALYSADHTTNKENIILWLSLKICTVIPRVFQAYLIKKDEHATSNKSKNIAFTLVFIDGMTWGLAGPLLLPVLDHHASTILGCSLMGIVAIATFTLHTSLKAMLAYCLPILTIPAVTYIFLGDSFGWFVGLGLLIFLFGFMSVGRRANANFTEMLWRRFSMDSILAEKDKALQEAERQAITKNQFVATMSHELRTPLHGILGLTRILQKEIANTDHLHKIVTIEKSGEHLLSLINSVLDFSRIEAKNVQLNKKIFNLENLVTEATEIMASTAIEKGLSFNKNSLIPKNTSVEGDPQKLKQVILNIIGNAIKFTHKGAISVLVQYQESTQKFFFQVTDNGIGISSKDLSTIFEPYKQAKNISGSIVGGTGLGLTIAREIAKAMNGDISCQSEVGAGSTFSFTALLPPSYKKEAEISENHSIKKFISQSVDKKILEKNRKLVLLAEDNDINALIAKAILNNLDVDVEHVTNGEDVIKRMMHPDLKRPDIILMDCQMPKIDGFEATIRLRNIEKNGAMPRIPIIAITASAMIEDNMKCIECGMDAHLSKPFSEIQIFDLIRKYA